jgi:hypothetical protein
LRLQGSGDSEVEVLLELGGSGASVGPVLDDEDDSDGGVS